jgi:MFS family permease
MTGEERRGWWMVVCLFLSMVLVTGPVLGTPSVFFIPLLKQFGMQRAQMSLMSSLMFVGFGLAAPFSGWLVDRVAAQIVMVSGAGIAGLLFLALGRIHSFPLLVAAYSILGFGAGGATFIPAQFVITNWFGARRGTAMGIVFVGTAVGPMMFAVIAQRLLSTWGLRVAYTMLGLPILIVAVPLIALNIRSRPAQAAPSAGVPQPAEFQEGLDIAAAVRGRSFWLLTLAFWLFGVAGSAIGFHYIAYLRGRGYDAEFAAFAMSLTFGAGALGHLAFGMLGDYMPSRFAMGLNLLVLGIADLLLLAAPSRTLVIVFALFYGFVAAGPTILEPMVAADSFGLKRFGSLNGLVHIGGTTGAVLGPVIAGEVYDLTGSYWPAFYFFIAIVIAGGVMVMMTKPMTAAPPDAIAGPATATVS